MVGKSKRKKANRSERGQSLVETALILPILLLLLAIVVDVSRAFDAMMILTNAVRQGARYASLEPSPTLSDVQAMVVADVVGSGTNITNMSNFNAGNVDVQYTQAVEVRVTATYDFSLWFGGILGMPTFNLEKSAIIRHTEESP
jgi:Flp pilus assembly protein TadG